MATRKQKTTGTFLGILAGAVLGYQFGETDEQKIKNMLLGAVAGGVTGFAITSLLFKNDTVNYTCFYKGKRVYEGICYGHRIDARIAEHEACGKLFDEVVVSKSKPRAKALIIERKRIFRHKPVLNIQHNSKVA